ncbi:hypothetical protein [Modicisalibacter xianhensis]|nr:hypothetical protein [Halomonas xianhensis]
MKSSRSQSRQMDEREKLRKFRELDDAFAQALRELDKSSPKPEPEAEEVPSQEDPQEFERRLRALMADFQQTDTSVDTLLRTMLKLGKIA